MSPWIRSSSCVGDECVELARDGDDVLLRNSARPDEVLRFTRDEWAAFLDGAKAGEFDALVGAMSA